MIILCLSRGVKYLSNFTLLRYLSIILWVFALYSCAFQTDYLYCNFTWLHFWRKKLYFLLLTIVFNLEKYITFLFYLMHIKYGQWKLNHRCLMDVGTNDHCFHASIHFHFSYDFHKVNVLLQKFSIKSEVAYWCSKVVFSKKSLYIYNPNYGNVETFIYFFE